MYKRQLKGRSATHILVDILHQWNKALDDGHSVRVPFIDCMKAFDHVDHNVILQKLKAYDVPDFIVLWITSFLCKRPHGVKVSESYSGWATAHGGMPQGFWLGPLIFIILIDDLKTQLLTHKYVVMYAILGHIPIPHSVIVTGSAIRPIFH